MKFLILFIIIKNVLKYMFPLKVKIKYNSKDSTGNSKNNNYVSVYFLNFFRVFKVKLNKNKNKKISKRKKEIKNKLKKLSNEVLIETIEKYLSKKDTFSKKITKIQLRYLKRTTKLRSFNLNFGIKFFDYIFNAYLVTSLNTVISIFFKFFEKNINFKNTKINIYSSNSNVSNFSINCIIFLNFANTMGILIRFIYLIFRRYIHGKKVSDRKFNDYCNDIN